MSDQQLFQLGEEAILVADIYGNTKDVIISEALYVEDFESKFKPRKDMKNGWFYSVNPDPHPQISGMWHQSTLRKKHKPSSQSFDQLIQNLKTPVPA